MGHLEWYIYGSVVGGGGRGGRYSRSVHMPLSYPILSYPVLFPSLGSFVFYIYVFVRLSFSDEFNVMYYLDQINFWIYWIYG